MSVNFGEYWAPPIDIPIIDAISQHCVLPSTLTASPGPFGWVGRPYFRWQVSLLDDPDVRTIGLQIAAQSGKSTSLLAIAIEYAFQRPGTVLYYLPDDDTLRSTGNKAIDIVLASPIYRNALCTYGNGTITKQALTSSGIYFKGGGSLVFLSAGSIGSFRSRTASLVILDEIDVIEANAQISGLGDVVSRASGRSNATLAPKLLLASTPTDYSIGISRHRTRSRAYVWEVPCPRCGAFDKLSLEQLTWTKTDDDYIIQADSLASNRQTPTYKCPHCHSLIDEASKLAMVEAGRPALVDGDKLSMRSINLQLSALYSTNPEVSWGKIASSFIHSAHDKSIATAFYTEVMASPTQKYAAAPVKKDDGVHLISLAHHRGVVPQDAFKIITGIDVQGKEANEYYHATLAIAPGGCVSVVDWGHCFGTPNLISAISTGLPVEGKDTILQRDASCIDTGYTATEIYRIVSMNRHLGMIPVKGANIQSRANNKLMWETSIDGYPGLMLNMIHPLKSYDLLADYIDNKKNGRESDVLVLPEGAEKSELWDHLRSEQKFIDPKHGYVWRTTGERTPNHLRDCIRYALCYAAKMGYLYVTKEKLNQAIANAAQRQNPPGFRQFSFS